MSILAVVRGVQASDLTLSLPFGLTGKVHASEALLSDALEGTTNLSEAYHKGMHVCAVVIAVDAMAKRVHLSLLPSRVNAGFDRQHLGSGGLVWGMVRSSEDHGYTVECGSGLDGRAFLPFSAHDGSNGLGHAIAVGGPILASVASVRTGAEGADGALTLACLSADYSSGKAAKKKASATSDDKKPKMVCDVMTRSKAMTLRALKAGAAVTATVVDTIPTGLVVKFLGFFTGTIALQHLPLPAHAKWHKRHAVGQKIAARVMFVDALGKTVGLSATPHVMGLDNAAGMGEVCAAEGSAPPVLRGVEAVRYGDIHQDAVVLRVDRKLGVLVGWGTKSQDGSDSEDETADKQDALTKRLETAAQWGHVAYVHVSRLADEKVASPQKRYLVGSTLPVRITGFAPADGTPLATSKPSTLSASVLRIEDAKPGSLLHGTVMLHTKGGSVLLALGGGVKALATRLHLSDVVSADGSVSARVLAQLAPETEVKCRVLTVDKPRRLALVTLKPSLVQTPLPALTSYAQAAAMAAAASDDDRAIVHGFASAARPIGLIVTMFGNVHGLVPKSDLRAVGVDVSSPDSIRAAYPAGKAVKVRIVSADAISGRMLLSLQLDGDDDSADSAEVVAGKAVMAQLANVSVGTAVSGATVVAVPQSWRDDESVDSSDAESDADDAAAGDALNDLVLVQLADGAPALLPVTHTSDDITLAPALARTLAPGDSVDSARVLSTRKVGRSTLEAHPHLKFALGDAFAAARAMGVTLQVPVLTRKPLLNTAVLSQRGVLGVTGTDDMPVLGCPSSVDAVQEGALVAGYVADVTAFGVFVRFLGGLTALASAGSLSDSVFDAPSDLFTQGQSVLGVISSVERDTGKLQVDLRGSVVAARASAVAPLVAGGDVNEGAPAQIWGGLLRDTLASENTLMRFLQAAADGGDAQGEASDSEEEAERKADADAERGSASVLDRHVVPVGSLCHGSVQYAASTGLTVRVTSVQAPGSEDALKVAFEGFIPSQQLAEGAPVPAAGDSVAFHALDLNVFNATVIGTMRYETHSAPLASGKKSAKKARKSKEGSSLPKLAQVPKGVSHGDLHKVTLLHLGRDARYAVGAVQIADGTYALGVVSLVEYAIPSVAASLPEGMQVGSEVTAMVTAVQSGDSLDDEATLAAPLLLSAPYAAPGGVQGGAPKLTGKRRKHAEGATEAAPAPVQPTAVPATNLRPGMLVRATVRATGVEEGLPTAAVQCMAAVHLSGVTGHYTASLPLDEVVNVDPYTGAAGTAAGTGRALPSLTAAFKSAAAPSVTKGQRVLVKILSVRCELPAPTGDAEADAAAVAAAHVHVTVTARSGDVDCLAGSVAAHRPVVASGPAPLAAVEGGAAAAAATPGKKSKKRAREPEGTPGMLSSGGLTVWCPPLIGAPTVPAQGAVSLSTPFVQASGVAVAGAQGDATMEAFLQNTPLVSFLRFGVGLALGSLGWGVVLGHTYAKEAPPAAKGGAPSTSPLPTGVLVGIGGGAVLTVPALECGVSLKQCQQLLAPSGVGALVPVVVTGVSPTVPRASAGAGAGAGGKKGGKKDKTKGGKGGKKDKAQRRSSAVDASVCGITGVSAASGSVRLGVLAHHQLADDIMTPGSAGSASAEAAAKALTAVRKWMRKAGTPAVGDAVVARVVLPRPLHGVPSQSELVRAAAAEDKKTKGSSSIVPPEEHAQPRLRLSLPGGVVVAPRHAMGGQVRTTTGAVDITHSAEQDQWASFPFDGVQEGTMLQVVVLATDGGKAGRDATITASMRPSLLARAAKNQLSAATIKKLLGEESKAALVPGGLVQGFIASTTPKGCFIRITPDVTGRVLLSDLADTFVKNVNAKFPPGKLVTARVKAYAAPKGKEDGYGRLDLSLRPSAVSGKGAGAAAAAAASGAGGASGGAGGKEAEVPLPLSSVSAGQVWTAKVRNVAEFGVFVNLCMPGSGSKVTTCRALCHVSEVTDENGATASSDALPSLYSAGDMVQVLVLSVAADTGKVSVSMHPEKIANAQDGGAAVTGADLADAADSDADGSDGTSDSDSDSGDEGEEDVEAALARMAAEDSDSDVEVTQVQVTDDMRAAMADMFVGSKTAAAAGSSDSEDGEGAADSGSDAASDSGDDSDSDDAATAAGGFDWATGKAISAGGNDDSDSDDEALGVAATAGSKKRKSTSGRGGISAAEDRLADDEAAPESVDDFERLIASDPGTALVWIRFMAWHVSMTDLAAARVVAERAVKTLQFRDEQEKQAVWLAYLNLEAAHGDAGAFDAVYKRALVANNEETIRLKVAALHASAGRLAQSEAEYAAAAKKFADNPKVWTQWAEARFSSGDAAKGRTLLQRALRGAHKSHHVALTQRFALLEFRSSAGSTERGRTLFEGLLAAYPKRLDLWFVYVDAEVKSGEVGRARGLLERLAGSVLGQHKMKSALNRYMRFEKEHGTAEGVAHVTRLAQAYVARLKAAGGSDSDSDSGSDSSSASGSESDSDSDDDDSE